MRDSDRDRIWMRQSRDRVYGELEASDRSRRALKGTVTKMRKRAIAGMCQFCHRSFADMRAHIESEHPDVGASDSHA